MIQHFTIITDLTARVEKLTTRNDYLEEENRRLEVQVQKLSKNSKNSSKPPSSDIVKPKKNQSNKNDSDPNKKRKQGAQPGHTKHTRTFYTDEQIDEFHNYILESCPECGSEVIPRFDMEHRRQQQIEIKKIPVVKTEHRSYAVWCPTCQKFHYKPFPKNVIKEGFFQERITTLVAYMKGVCHCSFSTIRKYIRDVLGEKISRGYLRKVLEKVTVSLDGSYDELLNRLPLETIVNADETGHKDKGDKFWTWLFRTDLYVLFKIDKSRATQVLIDVLGESFNGVLGCDYYSSYRCYMRQFGILIQFCIAHLIREVRFLTNLPEQENKDYGNRILDEIREMFKIIHNRDSFPNGSFQTALEASKKRIIEAATTNIPSRLDKKGKEVYKNAKNMAYRFNKHGESYFTFITTPNADPTNNIAEQAVRFVVIDRHITQGTRGEAGRKTSERLWTVIGTCQLQGRSAFNFILEAVHAYFNGQPSPSLIPSPT